MYFKPRAKPVLPRYAKTIEDVFGYVHDDGTIQPDIENMEFRHYHPASSKHPFILVRYKDCKSMVFAWDGNNFLGELPTHKFNLNDYQVVKWHDIPAKVQQHLRRLNTPADFSLDEVQ